MLNPRKSTDIHELGIERPPVLLAWSERYEALRHLPLIEKCEVETGFWPMYPEEETPLVYTDTQLLRILLETELDPTNARDIWTRLKGEPRLAGPFSHWNQCMMLRGIDTRVQTSFDQILSCIAEERLGMGSARELLVKLRETPLYEAETDTWWMYKEWKASGDITLDKRRPTAPQLLAAFIEGGDTARERWEALCAQARDPETGHWMELVPRDETERNSYALNRRATADQLCGLLLESVASPGTAHDTWKQLRASSFYDKEAGHWRHEMGWTTPPRRFHTSDQLLALFVQSMLEKASMQNDGTEPPGILDIQ